MVLKSKIASLLSVSVLSTCVAVPALAAGETQVGYDLYLGDENVNVGFVGETLSAKMYLENVADMKTATFLIKFNPAVAQLVAKDGSAVSDEMGIASSDFNALENGEDPENSLIYNGQGTGSKGVWFEDEFVIKWALIPDWGDWPAGSILNKNEKFTEINNTQGLAALMLACSEQGVVFNNFDEKTNVFNLNLKANAAGALDLRFMNTVDDPENYNSYNTSTPDGVIIGENLPYSFIDVDYQILEAPEMVTNLAYDEATGELSWTETENRGCIINIYNGGSVVATYDDIAYDAAAASRTYPLASFFDTALPGTYNIGVTAKGGANNSDEAMLASEIVIARPLDKPENLTWTDKTLSWDAVENADSYTLDIYHNGVKVDTVTTTTPSYDFANDFVSGDYYVEVTATNSEGLYTDSEKATSDPVSYGEIIGYTKFLRRSDKNTGNEGISVVFKDADGNVVAEATTLPDGKFIVSGLEADKQYAVEIDHHYTLIRRNITVNVTNETKTINEAASAIPVLEGDLIPDEIGKETINSADLSRMLDYLVGNNKDYDFDGNGVVDIGDYGHVGKYAGIGYEYAALTF